MRTFNLTVFDKTPESPMLRLTDSDGKLLGERLLNREDVSKFIDDVDRTYGTQSPDLLRLGESLYDWLGSPTERWLEPIVDAEGGLALYIETDEGLRHLPWELLATKGSYLGVNPLRPLTPVHFVSKRKGEAEVANRPLRVLFMATAPEGVQPVLDFEHEEAMILSAAGNQALELMVEESGSLAGLQYVFESFGAGYFDVLHLSGHAFVTDDAPVFVMEDDTGLREDATAEDVAIAVQGLWPGLVFLSGCMTGQASDEGAVPSMAEALVAAGAPAVLGWALPVGDISATILASELYATLSKGVRIDEATARARHELFGSDSLYWHLLRLYADARPLAELVTRTQTDGREVLRVRPMKPAYLDAKKTSPVAGREGFVGRRRQIQRNLRGLRNTMADDRFEILVLHGMGGLGKSTLAFRLLERMDRTHDAAVWVGKIDEIEIRNFTTLAVLDDRDVHKKINEILNDPELSIADRLRFMLSGPLAAIPYLFVFDDFESGNLEEQSGARVCTPEALEILTALSAAIRDTGSQSRVIITSRYSFPLPDAVRAEFESMESLHGPELDKKLRLTENLGPDSDTDPSLRERAIETATGNPRLIEWLDKVVSVEDIDHEALLEAIESEAARFREDVLASKLVKTQTLELQRVLARAGVYDLPVPLEAIRAVNEGKEVEPHLERAASIGIIEAGIDPETGESRYLVSNLIKPLLEEYISNDERVAAWSIGANVLYSLWVEDEDDGE